MCPWQVDAVKVAAPASPSTQGDDAKDLLLDTGIHSDMHHGVGNSSQCSKLRRKHLMADHDAFACPLHPGPSGVGAASSKDRAIKHDPVTQQVVMHADSSFVSFLVPEAVVRVCECAGHMRECLCRGRTPAQCMRASACCFVECCAAKYVGMKVCRCAGVHMLTSVLIKLPMQTHAS